MPGPKSSFCRRRWSHLVTACWLGGTFTACTVFVDDSRVFEATPVPKDGGGSTPDGAPDGQLDGRKISSPAYTLVAFRKSDVPQTGAGFGYPVQFLDDGTLLVGSAGATAGGVVEAGFLYTLSPSGSWNTLSKASADTPTAHAGYPEVRLPVFYNVNPPGLSVAPQGNTVLFGLAGEDGTVAGSAAKDTGAVYVATRNGGQLGGVTRVPTNAVAGSGLGFRIAATDGVVVVSAPWEDCDSGGKTVSQCGAVHVFRRSGGTLTEVEILHGSHTGEAALFGASIALSGDVLIVGAPGEPPSPDEPPSATGASTGAAYVFKASTTGLFTELRRLYPATRTLNAYYGTAVAFDGHLLAVGAPSATNPGQVELFEYIENAVRPLEVLHPTDAVSGCGFSLAFGDGVLLIGAPADQSVAAGVDGDPKAIDSSKLGIGAVHVYGISGTRFSPLAYLKADHPDKLDLYGMAVAASGRYVAVGAPGEQSKGPFLREQPTDNTFDLAGAVYVYERNLP